MHTPIWTLTKITLECVNEKLHYKCSYMSTNHKTSSQTQTKKHINKNYSDESMLASKSNGIHINPYIQLLKDNCQLHYLPCLRPIWKGWINKHFAPIQKLKGRCTILFLYITFKLPKAKKHKAQKTASAQNPPCPLHLTIQERVMTCYSFC